MSVKRRVKKNKQSEWPSSKHQGGGDNGLPVNPMPQELRPQPKGKAEESKEMKCETCKYGRMCRLRAQCMEVILPLCADITNTAEPYYSQTCKLAVALFDGCVNYEEKAIP